MTMPDGDPIHEPRIAEVDDVEWPPQAPQAEPDGLPRLHPSWRLVNGGLEGPDVPVDDRNLNFIPDGDFNFPPVDRSNPDLDDYPTEEFILTNDDTDAVDPTSPLEQPSVPPIRVGLQARAIAAGLRWLYKENEAGEIVPRKGAVRALAVGGMAVTGTLLAFRYGPDIAHHLFGGGSGAVHTVAPETVTQTSAPGAGSVATHGTAAPRPTVSPAAPPSGGSMAPTVATPSTQHPDGVNPKLRPGNVLTPGPSAPPTGETVTIGAHHKNSVWGELRAQNPNWTNAQIASAIDNTQQATGQNLSHVTAGEQVKLLAPQAPTAPVAPAEHAQLHAHGVHGGNVAPIQQPADSSVVYLQTGAAHNSVGAVVAQALQSNNISVKPDEFNKLVTGIVSYNHMQDVDEHSLPIGWPVYIPPEAMLRHLLEELGK